jgi:hypothetical protein
MVCLRQQVDASGCNQLLNWIRQAGTNPHGVTKEPITERGAFRPHCLCPDPVV